MSSINRLLANYSRQVSLPWPSNLAGKQRIWFAVYSPAEERRVRARLPEFEAETLETGHRWVALDLTRLLPEFLAAHKYREEILKSPQAWRPRKEIEARASSLLIESLSSEEADSATVVAIIGLASLFDFVRVSSLVESIEDHVPGRLLVFFPGEYTGNTYRFMDARDGFNYMAVPITSTGSFLEP